MNKTSLLLFDKNISYKVGMFIDMRSLLYHLVYIGVCSYKCLVNSKLRILVCGGLIADVQHV